MTDVSVIMPCYNQGYHLQQVLEAYDRQSTPVSFEVIAVDDASRDATFQILSGYRPQRYPLTVLHQETNQGPAAARNRGIEIAHAPLVIFVGDDILVEATFIQDHLEAHAASPATETAILGRVHWPEDMPVNHLMQHIDGVGAEQFSYQYFEDGKEYDYRHFYTANISLKRAMLERVDRWFDTNFPFAAYEDVELSYRLAKHGMKIYYDARPCGNHYHYHTIWSFAERQYRAGLMALVLGNKHPALRSVVLGKKWLPHLGWLAAGAILKPFDAQKAADLEQSVLRLCSHYEWSATNVLTDALFVQVLHYFYFKGIVQGFFEHTPLREKAVNFYSRRSLSRIVKWYAAESVGRGIPYPENLLLSREYL